jgi:hypothetical protein
MRLRDWLMTLGLVLLVIGLFVGVAYAVGGRTRELVFGIPLPTAVVLPTDTPPTATAIMPPLSEDEYHAIALQIELESGVDVLWLGRSTDGNPVLFFVYLWPDGPMPAEVFAGLQRAFYDHGPEALRGEVSVVIRQVSVGPDELLDRNGEIIVPLQITQALQCTAETAFSPQQQCIPSQTGFLGADTLLWFGIGK